MKKMRTKMMTILLVISMMTMSLSMMVSADENVTYSSTSTEGTLILRNDADTTGISIAQSTCNLYEVFNYYIDSDENTLVYDVQSEFEEFFAAQIGGEWSGVTGDDLDTDEFNAAAIEYVESFYVVSEETSVVTDNMQELVAELMNWIENKTVGADYVIGSAGVTSETGKTGAYTSGLVEANDVETITVTGIETGYYLIIDADAFSDDSGDSLITAGALDTIPRASLTNGTLDIVDLTVNVKGSQPTINKEVWHNDISNTNGDTSLEYGTSGSWDTVSDYQIGDIVEYRITATIPTDLTGYTDYTYIITDEMPDGITYNGDVQIYLNADLTGEVAGDSHVESTPTSGNGFILDIDMINVKKNLPNQVTFYVYYTGTVTSATEVYDSAEVNTVTLEYSSNPYDSSQSKTITDKVETYTFGLDVLKTAGDGSTPLEDAVFVLSYKGSESSDYVDIYLAYDEESDSYYPVQTDETKEIGVFDYATYEGCVVTDSTGEFNIKGLDDAVSYRLTEYKAPDGYNVASPIDFVINADYTAAANQVVTVTSSSVSTNKDNSPSVTVINTSSQLLPETGGMGTTIFMIVGGVMMLGALVLLVAKKRKVYEIEL